MSAGRSWPSVLKVGEIHSFSVDTHAVKQERVAWVEEKKVPPEAWRGCFQFHDGTIYLAGSNKSTDGGRTVIPHNVAGLDEISLLHQQSHPSAPGPEGTVLSRPGLFLALGGDLHLSSPGVFHVKLWRSTDNLRSIEEGQAVVKVPPGPKRDREKGEWFGLYITRNIVEMPDGSLLATAEGNFEEDKIVPSSGPGQLETHYLGRTFLISSTDDGQTWEYLSTVAAPQAEDPIDEGFGEPSLVRLDNGQLLCIMRTGHHRPLYACWSSDEGRSWTEPVYTGLERGCFPCMVKLADGRLALSYGVRFPPGWSRITPDGDHGRWVWPGAGLTKLAINHDGSGQDWEVTTLASGMGSCYTTSFEVEPNILFCQVDGWYCRIMLMPRIPDTL